MTEIEAHRIVSLFREEWDKNSKTPNAHALDVAIQALEKQIAKKPHKNFEKFSGVWCSCGKYLGKGYFVDKPSYCTDCGQKLNWESDEE